MFSIYRLFGKIFPLRIKKRIKKLLDYSNIDVEINRFLGFQLLFSGLFSLLLAVYLLLLAGYNFWIVLAVSFMAVQAFIYLWLGLSADKKGKFTESILPDVLQLMSSNLKAGVTIDKALFMAARPEFGPFKEELDRVGKEITIGKDLKKALLDLSARIRSEKLEKTIYIILSGLRSGGDLAPLLEKTAQDLRDQEIMDKKTRANISMYRIFIFIAIGLASPFLFGLSSVVVEVLTKMFSQVSMPNTSGTPLSISNISMSVDFIKSFSMLFISMSCILGSLVLGQVGQGKAKEGAKYMLPLILLSFAVFFAVRKLLLTSLGGLFGI
ncbi:MAG: type II secretion system F family protein [Candidatus Woesearchaeota archaeon]